MRRSLRLAIAALRVAARTSLTWPAFLLAVMAFGTVVRPTMSGLGARGITPYGVSLFSQAVGAVVLIIGDRVRRKARLIPYVMVLGLSGSATALAYALLWRTISGELLPLSVIVAELLNGSALLLAFHLVFTNVRHFGHSHSETFMRLRDAQQELRALRASSAALLADEHRALASRAQQELGPNLARIASLCDAGADVASQQLVSELRGAIDQSVRPLSHSMLEGSLEIPRAAATSIRPRLFGFARRLQVRELFRPEFLILIPLPLYLSTQYGLYGSAGLLQGVLTSVVEYAAMVLAVHLAPRQQLRRSLALAYVALIPVIATIPGALLIEVMIKEPLRQGAGFGAIYVRELGLAPALALALAYVFSSLENLDALRSVLRQVERELSEELVRQSQQIWAARQQWAYHIHGTVQGLLTAAMLHLQQPSIDWTQVRENIRAARRALTAAPVIDLALESVLIGVRDAWVGTCDIRYHLASDVAPVLDAMDNSLFALNEVLKEAVSNAIRHSGSSTLDVTLELQGSCLSVVVVGPVETAQGNQRPGLGTELFDHVATEWSLQGNELRLVLPLG